MRGGSDHEGDGGRPGRDRFTIEFEEKFLKKGKGFKIVESEGQTVIEERG